MREMFNAGELPAKVLPIVVGKFKQARVNGGSNYDSLRGLGQHTKKSHPDVANRRVDINRVKARVASEEFRLLAEAEVQALTGGNPPRFMNKYLHERGVLGPGRTHQSIANLRKRPAYAELRESLLAIATDTLASQEAGATGSPEAPPQAGRPSPSLDEIGDVRTEVLRLRDAITPDMGYNGVKV